MSEAQYEMDQSVVESSGLPPMPVAIRTATAVQQAPATMPMAPITPAQAKVDAVAALTLAAYQRAATLQLTPEESKALQADFPDEAFQPGAAGKENLIYIEHAHLRDRFSQVFGMGQWAIIPRNRWGEPFRSNKGTEGERIYVEAMLVIRGCFVGEAVGAMEYYPSNPAQNYGDAVEGAKTAAFRRCAKEFGVGLQAWKREWCEGWWARRRQNAPGRASAPARVNTPPVAQKPATAPAAAPVAAPKPELASERTRTWAISELEKAGFDFPTLTAYLTAVGMILPGEGLLDWPLEWVPTSKAELAAIVTKVNGFSNGEPAERPYSVHGALKPVNLPTRAEVQAPVSPAPAPAPAPAAPADEAWWDTVVPIPRKGMRRDEYLRAPDTIRSLYDMRHGNDDESAAARQRLWGFINHFEPKPWVNRDGKEMPPGKADIAFRAALDALADWHEKNHPDEKI